MISELQRLNIYPSESGFDAIIIGLMVYIADMKISRRKQSQDSWTREITLSIPVYDSKWMNHRNTIERMLKFLTGDIWTLEFSKREERFAISDKEERTDKYRVASLFSGARFRRTHKPECIPLFCGGHYRGSQHHGFLPASPPQFS